MRVARGRHRGAGARRRHRPAVTSRALGLQPRGVEVLDRVGALGDLPERALPINKVVITVEGRELARLQIGLAMERLGGRTGLIISQAEIEAALRKRLAELGGTIEWGHRVSGLDARADGVTVLSTTATKSMPAG